MPETETPQAKLARLGREHAAIEPRGFDSQRDRAAIQDQIDAVLDLMAST